MLEHELMRLSGYVRLTEHGFALPAYGVGLRPNAWYIAVAAIEGDHVAPIARFELLEGEEVTPLLGVEIEIRVGDPWQDVFLWDNRAFAGTPTQILEALDPYKDDLRRLAPLSYLDLVMASETTAAKDLAANARAFLEARPGGTAVATSFGELVLRPHILLALHRQCCRGEREVELPAAARNFVMREYEPGRFEAELVPGTTAALGGVHAAAELTTYIEQLGTTLGFPLRAAGLEPDNVLMDDEMPEPNPELSPSPPADDKLLSQPDRLPRVIVLSTDRRAAQIARYLEPPLELTLGARSVSEVRHYRFDRIDSSDNSVLFPVDTVDQALDRLNRQAPSQYDAIIWLVGNETLRNKAVREQMMMIARVARQQNALFLLAPAPPPDGPSTISDRDSDAVRTLGGVPIIDTTLARSPFWTGQPRRSFDRRMADIVATVGIVASLHDDLRKALGYVPDTMGNLVLSFYRGKAATASEMSTHGYINLRPSGGPSVRANFEMRDRADRRVHDAFIELHHIQADFDEFAEVAVAEALGLSTTERHFGPRPAEIPEPVRRSLEAPWMATAISLGTQHGRYAIIVAEAPDLKVLRAAAEIGSIVIRYTDRATIRTVFRDKRIPSLPVPNPTVKLPFDPAFPSLPGEIRLPPLGRYARNRGLATRGIDPRDVVRFHAHRWDELLRTHERSELGWHARRYVAAIDVSDHEPEIVLPLAALWNAMRTGDALACAIAEESLGSKQEHAIAGKRIGDLAAAWSQPAPDCRRWVIEDGRIPVEIATLKAGEVPAQRLFLIDGDGAVPTLLMSRLFAVWARAQLRTSTSWSSRFQVGQTFETFPIPPSFQVVPAENGSPAQLRVSRFDSMPSRLREIIEYTAELLAMAPHRHDRDEGLMEEMDKLLATDIGFSYKPSDLEILERLVDLNSRNA